MDESSVQKQNLNLHRVFEREKSKPWFANLTDIQVPDSVQDILRLRKGFSSYMMNDKSKQKIEIVKDIEANIHKIRKSDQQDFRNKVLHLSKGLVEKKSLHINSIHRKFANNLKTTKDFLTKNKDLMFTNADKGNISVLMRRSEYIRDMEELLGNVENFEILDQDPLKKLTISSFRMADNWRKRGLLGKDTRRRDIDTTNTVLARCYGLRKIHKENYPLRLVISTINTPTRFLELDILSKSLNFFLTSSETGNSIYLRL